MPQEFSFMAKYLIVVPPFYGHISITLAIGTELAKKGHTVHWFCLKELSNIFVPENSKFIVPQAFINSEQVQAICDVPNRHYISVFKSMKVLLEEAAIPLSRLMMPVLENYVKEFKPNVIISDQLAFAGPIIAYKHKIPYATSWSVPFGIPNESGLPPKVFQWMQSTYINHQKEFDILTDELMLFSKEMNLVPTSKEFMQVELQHPYYMVGPLIKGRKQQIDFDWDALHASSKPKVLISLGTVQTNFQKKFFKIVTEAFKDMDCTFVAVANPDTLEEWPENFIVQSHIPQLEVLSYMDALIGHGGQNTTSEALYEGIPLLILPIANDAFEVAEQVEKVGCGLRVNFYRLKSDKLAAALNELLTNPSYRNKSQFIKQSFINAGGVEKATSLLTGMIKPEESFDNVIYF